MGIILSKIGPSSTVDYGKTKTQGLYTTNLDYDSTIATQLVQKGRLAPFYKGAVDPIKNKKPNYTCECPICFLYYPSSMNKTQCCDNTLCTDCFLQLKRSSTTPLIPAVCPFCVQPNLGVLYMPPSWSKFYNASKKQRTDLFPTCSSTIKEGRRKWKLSSDDPDVVLVDHVRPNWKKMMERSSYGTTRRTRIRIHHQNNNNNNQQRRRRRVQQQQQQQQRQSIASSISSSSIDSIYDTNATMDLEDILVMEAIRLSLADGSN
ncbi:hypothetical protein K501DRAFT_178592 [Backusella circina FSU 941]|nr:hypothetical protein K501DRAFT_178592 [Backusella circina FSU 941]